MPNKIAVSSNLSKLSLQMAFQFRIWSQNADIQKSNEQKDVRGIRRYCAYWNYKWGSKTSMQLSSHSCNSSNCRFNDFRMGKHFEGEELNSSPSKCFPILKSFQIANSFKKYSLVEILLIFFRTDIHVYGP